MPVKRWWRLLHETAKACIAIRELTPSKSPAWFLLCSPSGCLHPNLKMCEP